MPMVVSTETSAAKNSISSIARSLITRARRCASRVLGTWAGIVEGAPGATADMGDETPIMNEKPPAAGRGRCER